MEHFYFSAFDFKHVQEYTYCMYSYNAFLLGYRGSISGPFVHALVITGTCRFPAIFILPHLAEKHTHTHTPSLARNSNVENI